MPRVRLEYDDGQYSVRAVAASEPQDGPGIVLLDDRVLDAWYAHVAQGAVFHALFAALDGVTGRCGHNGCGGTVRELVCDRCHST